MPDPFRRVRPGEEVDFSAGAWNAMLDAALFVKQQRDRGGDRERTQLRQAGIIQVKNESGAARNQFEVLGLNGPIFTPSDSVEAFAREVTFRGIEPTSDHRGKFAVLLEAAPVDRVVQAYVAGVCQVRVDVLDVAHQFAEVIDGDATRLRSAGAGSAQILWKETEEAYYGYETGEQWAIVRLGVRSCGRALAMTPEGGIAAGDTGTVTYLDDPDNLSDRTDEVTNPWETDAPGLTKCEVGYMDGVPGLALLPWDCAPWGPYYY